MFPYLFFSALAFCDYDEMHKIRKKILAFHTFPRYLSAGWKKLDKVHSFLNVEEEGDFSLSPFQLELAVLPAVYTPPRREMDYWKIYLHLSITLHAYQISPWQLCVDFLTRKSIIGIGFHWFIYNWDMKILQNGYNPHPVITIARRICLETTTFCFFDGLTSFFFRPSRRRAHSSWTASPKRWILNSWLPRYKLQ